MENSLLLKGRAILIATCFCLVICQVTCIEKTDSSEKKICSSPGCTMTAASVLQKLDTSVKPCDNFYKFACGKFMKESIITDDKPSISTFTQIQEKVQQRLRASLEQKTEKKIPRIFKMLQSFYDICLDTDKIEKNSKKDAMKIINEMGCWPAIDKNCDPSNFDWIKFTYKSANMGFRRAPFMSFDVMTDERNSNKYLINLNEPTTEISKAILAKGFDDKIVQAYYKYMMDLAEYFGANRQQAEKEMKEALNFEIEMAKMSMDVKKCSPKYMRMKQLESEYPDIAWTEYFKQILSPKTCLQPDEEIMIKCPCFLSSLSKLIKNTPKRTMANYAMWRIIQESSAFMDKRVENMKKEFMTSLASPILIREPRQTQCINFVMTTMPFASGALFAREYFDKMSKDAAEKIVNELRESFGTMIDKATWMDDKTKQRAKKKLSMLCQRVAYPDEIFDDEKLDECYQSLETDEQSFLKSQLNIMRFKKMKNLEKLRKPVDKTDWITYGQSAMMNTYYSPLDNSLFVPVGILQDDFFSNDRPNYMNFAAIGSLIGRALVYGFDAEGSKYDEEGNRMDWWSAETRKEFDKRSKCIVEQYNNYTAKEVCLKINGTKTLRDNVADNVATKLAYLAYDKLEKKNGEEACLPGLECYTSRQMFWISAAEMWCSKSKPELMKLNLAEATFSPGEFRVMGPFSNIPEFSRDFGCPAGSPMNPVKKCNLC